jgi:hypothetical protein
MGTIAPQEETVFNGRGLIRWVLLYLKKEAIFNGRDLIR